MTIKDIKEVIDNDTKIMVRDYMTRKWLDNNQITTEIENKKIRQMYTKAHKCGNPPKMRTQLVVMV